MKRLIAALLLLCMLAALTACSAKKEGTKPPEDPKPSTAATQPVPQKTEAPTQTEPTQEVELSHGRIDGDAYVNESLNLRIAKPDGFTFYTEEQIAQQNGLTVERFKGSSVAEMIEKNGSMFDMVMASATGDNVNLVLQPLPAGMDFYSDGQVFDLMKAGYYQQFEAAGMSLSSYEIEKANLFGEERDILHITLNYLGSQVTEYQIMLREPGCADYGIITVSYVAPDSDVQTMLDSFTRVH